MAITVTSIYEEALNLSGDSRVTLAERLLESVTPDPKIFEAQLATANRRAAEMESGAVQGIPGPQALQQVRDSIFKLARS
jgi:hypothetical protein